MRFILDIINKIEK